MAKRKVEESSGGEASWMNTFADLMNLLLCFFVLLFAMSTVDAEKWDQLIKSMNKSSFSILSSGGASVGDGMMISSGVSQLEMLDDYFKEKTNSADKEAEESEPKDKEEEPTAEEEVIEEFDAMGLKESEEMAQQIEQMLKEKQIETQAEVDVNAQFVRITLNGALLFDSAQSQIREDALPLVDKLSMILENYDVLSAYRAFAVKDYVLEHTALEPGKIYAAGCGEYNPVADNSTAEGRARNRRVEIKIYNSYNSN